LSLSEKQAQILNVEAYTRWSPYLTKCCLLLSANESYARAAEDIEVLTGVAVSHGTQQRLVHRQTFELPQVEQAVEEISVDGGKVRLRTAKGEPSECLEESDRVVGQTCGPVAHSSFFFRSCVRDGLVRNASYCFGSCQ